MFGNRCYPNVKARPWIFMMVTAWIKLPRLNREAGMFWQLWLAPGEGRQTSIEEFLGTLQFSFRKESVFPFYLPGNRGWLLQNAFMDGSAAITGQVQSPAGFFHALLAEGPAKSSSDLSSYGCCPECCWDSWASPCLPTRGWGDTRRNQANSPPRRTFFPSLPLFLYLFLFFFSTHFSLPLSFLFWSSLMYLRVTSDLLCSQGWTWIPDLPASTSQMLGLQECTIRHSLHSLCQARDRTRGIVCTRQANILLAELDS